LILHICTIVVQTIKVYIPLEETKNCYRWFRLYKWNFRCWTLNNFWQMPKSSIGFQISLVF